jgi:hypothetical protein
MAERAWLSDVKCGLTASSRVVVTFALEFHLVDYSGNTRDRRCDPFSAVEIADVPHVARQMHYTTVCPNGYVSSEEDLIVTQRTGYTGTGYKG